MARPSPDLDAYWRRLGCGAEQAPTLRTLRELHRLHPFAIPFENLTTLLGECPALDLPSLEEKMIRGGRGGYCFEHNRLFAGVLEALGFDVTGLAARVLWERASGAPGPRTHMLLAVEADGRRYISDVGFGGLTLTAPLLLEAGREQPSPHEVFRLVADGDGYVLEARLPGAWRPLYWFDVRRHLDVDYDVLNHFVATHPDSPFHSMLYGARALPDRRLALRNGLYTVYALDGEQRSRELDTVEDLRDVLTADFGIAVPDGPRIDDALARVLASA